MSEYPHQHRVLGQGMRVSPTGSIATPTPLNLDRWENLVQSSDNNAAGGGDFMQGSESGEQLWGHLSQTKSYRCHLSQWTYLGFVSYF